MSLSDFPVMPIVTISERDRALAFYRDTLGLEVLSDDGFGIMLRAANATVRLAIVKEVVPPQGTALGWEVTGIEGIVDQLVASGVVFERFPGMAQDARAIWTPPGASAGVAWFKDPFGNLLSVSGPR